METKHTPVLLQESLAGLDLKVGETYLDGTLGGGGHTKAVLEKVPGVKIIALDQDREAVERFREMMGERQEITLITENFKNLDKVLENLGVTGVDAILLDLGFSSDQLEMSGRGFSFQRDEPLDMRLSPQDPQSFTAAQILNSWDESAIGLILQGFGEERFSRKIAEAIVERRALKPFRTTFDLIEVVRRVKPKRPFDKIHPATQTFQALRIAVNGELDALEAGLKKGFEALRKGGRLAVISFHSLEDRMAKNFFRDLAKEGQGRLITKKPTTPSETELRENPRSRSAKLRIFEKNED